MKSYLIRRLLPFFVFMYAVEFGFTVYMLAANYEKVDWSAWELVKTLAVMSLTTLISFLYMMIPYVLFLLFLPRKRQNGLLDKIVSVSFYGIFVYVSLFEEVASLVFWDEFSAAFNFIAVDYLVYTHEVISNICQSYPVIPILLAVLIVAILAVSFTCKYLFTNMDAPVFVKRFSHVAVYGLVCLLSYATVDISDLEIGKNHYNNEIAKEGTYSLFSAFLKNELSYDGFYITGDDAENLEILQDKLGGKNVTFTSPQNGIRRFIRSEKPENRANVIIVLMESMSSLFLNENRESWMRLITPNLSRLSEESIFFSRTYATGTRSVRGIEALTLGIPPLPGMSIVRRQNNENLYNIGSIFKAKGYENKWIYGGYGYFDNMNHFFENNGFEVLDRKRWEKGEVSFVNAWGAADEDTFAKVIKEADKSFAAGKPFLTMVLTISNHRPYTYPEGRIDLKPKVSKREGGVKYADYALGKFLDDASRKPWFDNTVFVLVADHTAGASGDAEINLEEHHIPLMFYAPKLFEPKRIDMPISQLDVLPTLLGLLNFDYESRFYGQDALSPDYESRFFVSNYQKLGYVKDSVDVILKPVRKYSVEPETVAEDIVRRNLREAVAFYQQASDWVHNLKE